MKYKATSVSLRYHPNEDRIEWSSHCGGDTQVRTWITRRMLALSLPRLAKWLGGRTEAAPQVQKRAGQTVAEQQHIGRFEHEVAQRQVKAVREKPVERQSEGEFVLANMSLEAKGRGIRLMLYSERNQDQVVLGATLPQLHKLIGELIRLSEAAKWGLPDPWAGGIGTATSSTTGAMH